MLGFVTGLTAEARLLSNVDCLVAVGGGTPAGARRAADSLVARNVTGLISFGLAGGLDPALRAGSIVIPKSVLSGRAEWECDRTLSNFLGGTTAARVTGASSIVVSADAKATLYATTNAAAVDLESTIVATVACDACVPFAVLRAVADPAWRDLPPASLVALDASGNIAIGSVLRSIFNHPRQLSGMVKLAADAAAARNALKRRIELRLAS